MNFDDERDNLLNENESLPTHGNIDALLNSAEKSPFDSVGKEQRRSQLEENEMEDDLDTKVR